MGPRLTFPSLGIRHAVRPGVEALDFSADIGAVAFVEIKKVEQSRIDERLSQTDGEMAGEIRPVVKIEIHREERRVAGDVDTAEPVVEFDAVVDRQPGRREMDVVEVQVAVAIANPILPNPRRENGGAVFVKRLGVMSDGEKGGTRNRHIDEAPRLPEVLVGAELQLRDTSPVGDLRRWLLCFVKRLQRGNDPIDIVRCDCVPLHQPQQEKPLGESAHFHSVFDDLFTGTEYEAAFFQRDRQDPEIHAWRKPGVERHLALAKMAPLPDG